MEWVQRLPMRSLPRLALIWVHSKPRRISTHEQACAPAIMKAPGKGIPICPHLVLKNQADERNWKCYCCFVLKVSHDYTPCWSKELFLINPVLKRNVKTADKKHLLRYIWKFEKHGYQVEAQVWFLYYQYFTESSQLYGCFIVMLSLLLKTFVVKVQLGL